MSATLQWGLCQRHFSGNFPKFLVIATFQNFVRLCTSALIRDYVFAFLVQFLLNSTSQLLHMFFVILNSKNFHFTIMLPLIKYVGKYFEKCAHVFSDLSSSSRPEVFCKENVLRSFVKFTEKYLCQESLY